MILRHRFSLKQLQRDSKVGIKQMDFWCLTSSLL